MDARILIHFDGSVWMEVAGPEEVGQLPSRLMGVDAAGTAPSELARHAAAWVRLDPTAPSLREFLREVQRQDGPYFGAGLTPGYFPETLTVNPSVEDGEPSSFVILGEASKIGPARARLVTTFGDSIEETDREFVDIRVPIASVKEAVDGFGWLALPEAQDSWFVILPYDDAFGPEER
jgi:hypothetical protein